MQEWQVPLVLDHFKDQDLVIVSTITTRTRVQTGEHLTSSTKEVRIFADYDNLDPSEAAIVRQIKDFVEGLELGAEHCPKD